MIKVGRSSSNDIVISNDQYVSGTHCEFIQDENGDYWVVDLNSKNGTFVNGVRRSGKMKLNSNDMVRIGNTMLPWMNYLKGMGGPTYVPDPANGGSEYPPVEQPKKGNGFGIPSLIFGLVGFSLLAIIFGIVSLCRKEKSRGLGVAGLVLGAVGLLIKIVVIIFIVALDMDSPLDLLYYYL